MSQFIKAVPLLIMIFFISCSESKTEPAKTDYESLYKQQLTLDSFNEKESVNISTHRNAIVGWDTTIRFTYYLQELFQSTDKPISFIGEINDICKKDSTYILKVYHTNIDAASDFIAEISVPPSKFQDLITQIESNTSQEGCFIFQVSDISTHYPRLSSGIDEDGPLVENASSYVTLSFTLDLVKFKGELIDFYIFKSQHRKNKIKF